MIKVCLILHLVFAQSCTTHFPKTCHSQNESCATYQEDYKYDRVTHQLIEARFMPVSLSYQVYI